MIDYFNPTDPIISDDEKNSEAIKVEAKEAPLEPKEPEKKQSLFDFATTNDIDSFIKEAKETPKQQYDTPEQTAVTTEAQQPIITVAEQKKLNEKALKGAKVVVSTFDFVFQTGANIFLDTEDDKVLEEFKTKDADKKEMIDAWADYLETTNWNIPPWLTVVIVMVTIYGFKVPALIRAKKKLKAAKKEAELAAQIKAKREEIVAKMENQDKGSDPEITNAEVVNEQTNTSIKIRTTCAYCGTNLTADQIKRNQKFCSSSHSSLFRYQTLKQKP